MREASECGGNGGLGHSSQLCHLETRVRPLQAQPTPQSLHLDSKGLSDLPSSSVDRIPGTWEPWGHTATRFRKWLVAAVLPAANPRPGRECESPGDESAQVHIFLEGREGVDVTTGSLRGPQP